MRDPSSDVFQTAYTGAVSTKAYCIPSSQATGNLVWNHGLEVKTAWPHFLWRGDQSGPREGRTRTCSGQRREGTESPWPGSPTTLVPGCVPTRLGASPRLYTRACDERCGSRGCAWGTLYASPHCSEQGLGFLRRRPNIWISRRLYLALRGSGPSFGCGGSGKWWCPFLAALMI